MGVPRRALAVHCAKCQAHLLSYMKGGTGKLVKCFFHRTFEDFTVEKGVCHKCGVQFGRVEMIQGKPAVKLIGGKIVARGG